MAASVGMGKECVTMDRSTAKLVAAEGFVCAAAAGCRALARLDSDGVVLPELCPPARCFEMPARGRCVAFRY